MMIVSPARPMMIFSENAKASSFCCFFGGKVLGVGFSADGVVL